MTKLLLTIVFIVGSLVGGFYVVYPNYTEYQIKIKEGEILYEELENMMVYVTELKEIEKKIAENEGDLAKIRSAFPEDHDAPSFFLYLKEKVEEHNLESGSGLGGFSVKDYATNNTQHGRIKEILFSLEISGNYENVKGFFKDIEKLIRIISINDISIAGNLSSGGVLSPQATGEDVINISISGSTYSY